MAQHMGLGDALTCNGLTRWVVEEGKYKKPIGLFVRPVSFESVAWMYRDLPADQFVPIKLPWRPPLYDDFREIFEAAYPWQSADPSNRQILNLTMFEEHGGDYGGPVFDENFYRWAGIPIADKFKRFRCDRDPDIEIPGDPEVVFMHDDSTRGFLIDRRRMGIPAGTRVVHGTQNFHVSNIWALRDVIEKAKEVHVINSAFLNMADYLKPQGKLVWHRLYARNEVSWPTLRLDWKILD